MEKVSVEEQKTIDNLTANWIWVPDWSESPSATTAGRLVYFHRNFDLNSAVSKAVIHCSADTRYKLIVNGTRIAVGPARSSTLVWYYDTIDISSHLHVGRNEIKFIVVRYAASSRHAMHFPRTAYPGLTVIGAIEAGDKTIDLSTNEGWAASVDHDVIFPYGLVDDVFLHINERKHSRTTSALVTPVPYRIRTVNGELSPWRLQPRGIAMPEETDLAFASVHNCKSSLSKDVFTAALVDGRAIDLPDKSDHHLDIVAELHSTAFLTWQFHSKEASQVVLKVTYSEGYEKEPRAYPFFRVKDDCLDHANGLIIGPFDEVTIDVPAGETVSYEPFWFRTFRVLRVELRIGNSSVSVSLRGTQVNYPLATKGYFRDAKDAQSEQIWDVAVRTMRNCMFDGYSDCPFYEQLQYVGDSRTAGLFHYLMSGDDLLMRRTISNFASSITVDGLTQSRFPSHVPQIIAGFSLIWILQVWDHYLHFGDDSFARAFLPRIDGVLDYFRRHLDDKNLVAGLPVDVWQFIDWVTIWGATESHPDKGVPTAGRATNTHTYFSMLYVYTLEEAASLYEHMGRTAFAHEYRERASTTREAIKKHCFDGTFFTDSTVDVVGNDIYSQHCQVFGVLAGCIDVDRGADILLQSFNRPDFSKCSYMMMFYAFRAFRTAGVYDRFWPTAMDPWRQMLKRNLTTFEEDDVRQRSSCHCWSSVPLYEYATQIAGVNVTAPGSKGILFSPAVHLTGNVEAKVALGHDNSATVSWKEADDGAVVIQLHLEKAIDVKSILPGGGAVSHGQLDKLVLRYEG